MTSTGDHRRSETLVVLAAGATIGLGELLRASLRRDANLLVPLRRELEYAGHYLAIEQMNMQDRLKVNGDIPADTLGCAVPERLLQPLVENAVRHGLQPLQHGGSVLLRARRAGDRLTLPVTSGTPARENGNR